MIEGVIVCVKSEVLSEGELGEDKTVKLEVYIGVPDE